MKKINLSHLKVKSFVVELNSESQLTAKGGNSEYFCSIGFCPPKPIEPIEPPGSGTPACGAPKSWWQNCKQS